MRVYVYVVCVLVSICVVYVSVRVGNKPVVGQVVLFFFLFFGCVCVVQVYA